MDDEIPESPIGFPVRIDLSGSGSYNVEHKKITFDSKVYPPCTNKIEELGRIKKRKFSIVCDGQGNMKLEEIMNPFEKIERLGKLLDKGLISQEDFDKKKKEILDNEV